MASDIGCINVLAWLNACPDLLDRPVTIADLSDGVDLSKALHAFAPEHFDALDASLDARARLVSVTGRLDAVIGSKLEAHVGQLAVEAAPTEELLHALLKATLVAATSGSKMGDAVGVIQGLPPEQQMSIMGVIQAHDETPVGTDLPPPKEKDKRRGSVLAEDGEGGSKVKAELSAKTKAARNFFKGGRALLLPTKQTTPEEVLDEVKEWSRIFDTEASEIDSLSQRELQVSDQLHKAQARFVSEEEHVADDRRALEEFNTTAADKVRSWKDRITNLTKELSEAGTKSENAASEEIALRRGLLAEEAVSKKCDAELTAVHVEIDTYAESMAISDGKAQDETDHINSTLKHGEREYEMQELEFQQVQSEEQYEHHEASELNFALRENLREQGNSTQLEAYWQSMLVWSNQASEDASSMLEWRSKQVKDLELQAAGADGLDEYKMLEQLREAKRLYLEYEESAEVVEYNELQSMLSMSKYFNDALRSVGGSAAGADDGAREALKYSQQAVDAEHRDITRLRGELSAAMAAQSCHEARDASGRAAAGGDAAAAAALVAGEPIVPLAALREALTSRSPAVTAPPPAAAAVTALPPAAAAQAVKLPSDEEAGILVAVASDAFPPAPATTAAPEPTVVVRQAALEAQTPSELLPEAESAGRRMSSQTSNRTEIPHLNLSSKAGGPSTPRGRRDREKGENPAMSGRMSRRDTTRSGRSGGSVGDVGDVAKLDHEVDQKTLLKRREAQLVKHIWEESRSASEFSDRLGMQERQLTILKSQCEARRSTMRMELRLLTNALHEVGLRYHQLASRHRLLQERIEVSTGLAQSAPVGASGDP